MTISEVHPENNEVVPGSDVKAITNASKYQRRALTQRAQKRARRWERNHELAEEHCKAVLLSSFTSLSYMQSDSNLG